MKLNEYPTQQDFAEAEMHGLTFRELAERATSKEGSDELWYPIPKPSQPTPAGEAFQDFLEVTAGRTAAEMCYQPVITERVNLKTGEFGKFTIPCRSKDAQKCPPCADLRKRLTTRRMRDVMEQEGTQTLLLTLTAPSFGRVHRAYWTHKSEWAARQKQMNDVQVRALKHKARKANRPCPCGSFHTYEDACVGTPFGEYDYAAQTIWTKNLPNLMKSAVRRLQYIAEHDAGVRVRNLVDDDGTVTPSQLSLFSVYEAQARGALHAHTLVSVTGNREGFQLLADALGNLWQSPSAAIPSDLAAWYLSDAAQARADMPEHRSLFPKPVRESVPYWFRRQGNTLQPATRFGDVYDVRVLQEEAKNGTSITNQAQAANYLSKYLSKVQRFFSPEAIRERSSEQQRRHAHRQRAAAVALLTDPAVKNQRVRFLRRQANGLSQQMQEMPGSATLLRSRYDETLAELRDLEDVARATETEALADSAIPLLANVSVTHEFMRLYASRSRSDLNVSYKQLRIQLNRLADHAGFSGASSLAKNWGQSFAAMYEQMREHTRSLYAPSVSENGSEPAEYEWTLLHSEMQTVQVRRRLLARERLKYSNH